MTLNDLYKKLPVSKHQNIKIVGDMVLYDTGTEILKAYIDQEGKIVPDNAATRTALGKL